MKRDVERFRRPQTANLDDEMHAQIEAFRRLLQLREMFVCGLDRRPAGA